MENREYAADLGATSPHSLDSRDEWLDRALEDTFPASDPIAANRYD